MEWIGEVIIFVTVLVAWRDIRSLLRTGGKNRWSSRKAEHGRIKTWRMNRP